MNTIPHNTKLLKLFNYVKNEYYSLTTCSNKSGSSEGWAVLDVGRIDYMNNLINEIGCGRIAAIQYSFINATNDYIDVCVVDNHAGEVFTDDYIFSLYKNELKTKNVVLCKTIDDVIAECSKYLSIEINAAHKFLNENKDTIEYEEMIRAATHKFKFNTDLCADIDFNTHSVILVDGEYVTFIEKRCNDFHIGDTYYEIGVFIGDDVLA